MRALGFGENPEDAEKLFRAFDADGSGMFRFVLPSCPSLLFDLTEQDSGYAHTSECSSGWAPDDAALERHGLADMQQGLPLLCKQE